MRRKGDQKFLVSEKGIAIEDGGTYKGYEWVVTMTHMGHKCGYVAISEGREFYGKSMEEFDFDVHGGITFAQTQPHVAELFLGDHSCTDMWIGFDAAHGGDNSDYTVVAEIWPHLKETMEQMAAITKDTMRYGQIRSAEYMKKECHKLIDQLLAA